MNSPLLPGRHLPPGPPIDRHRTGGTPARVTVRSTIEAEHLLSSGRLQVN